jgi:hypothetical protein
MNKAILVWLVLFLGLSCQAFAKAGLADDEIEFYLAIVGFFTLLFGIGAGISYLIKNGRDLLNRFMAFLRKEDFNR